jgi:hypothetical protein
MPMRPKRGAEGAITIPIFYWFGGSMFSGNQQLTRIVGRCSPTDRCTTCCTFFLPKRFSIPHNVLMQPKSFSNLRGAELFRNRQVISSTLIVGSILS